MLTNPSPSAELELMRAAALLDSDPAGAARRAGELLRTSPGHPEAGLLFAAACRALGDPAAAVTLLATLVGEHPTSPLFQLELGRALAAAGRSAEARAALHRAVELDPGLADAWRSLAAELHAAGETAAGDVAYGRYLDLSPDPPELAEAAAALSDDRPGAAQAMLRERLMVAPRDCAALRLLAEAASRRGDHREAERALAECLALAPGHAKARYELALLRYAQQNNAAVLPEVERLLAADPGNVKYLSLKAAALRLLGRNAEALAVMERVVADSPGDARMWILYGHVLRAAGRQPEAIDAYRRSLARRPESGEAYWSLANLKTVRFDAADVAAMRAQLAAPAVQGADRIHLEFALGKALEDEQRYAESFEHYAAGNRLERRLVAYDVAEAAADVLRWQQVFTREFFAARVGTGSDRRDPIFIVGLPRSGSTLIEQMLASHSQVDGTRELGELGWIADSLGEGASGGSRYPEVLRPLGREAFAALATRYLDETRIYRSGSRARFVDKMLFNFGHVGLIQLLFPNAAIIDARRHPLGCGFSCYKQLFVGGIPFSYDQAELGRYYRAYADLMQHFDTVLPGRVHRVHYERLVTDPERELRRLLEYCGLPFEPQCLRFYENRRVVQTFSSEQVRQPLYTEGVDQWRHYEPWLAPLREALGRLVDEYPAAAPARGA